jgi:hypothetical protein
LAGAEAAAINAMDVANSSLLAPDRCSAFRLQDGQAEQPGTT